MGGPSGLPLIVIALRLLVLIEADLTSPRPPCLVVYPLACAGR
jgi:hypothetical protein